MIARHFFRTPAALVFSLAAATASLGQATKMATIHGHAQNPAGTPIAAATVFALAPAQEPADSKFTAVTDANGDYKLTGLPAGSYTFAIQDKTQLNTKKVIDQTDKVTVAADTDTEVNFDLTRAEYLAKLSPEERAKIEAVKAKNASTNVENKKIQNLNAILKQERDARAAKNYDQATALAQQITEGKPAAAIGWLELGQDQAQSKKYDAAIPNLQKAIQINSADPKPDANITRVANIYLGDSLLNTGKTPDAVAAYTAAAGADPTKAGGIYADGAIQAYNKNNLDLTGQLADKAIAADPKAAEAYYLKGQVLINKATMDKAGNMIAPPGCADAYKMYLQLEPNGQHAAEAQQILQALGSKVGTTYKGGKK